MTASLPPSSRPLSRRTRRTAGRRRALAALAVIAALAALLGACGGDDDATGTAGGGSAGASGGDGAGAIQTIAGMPPVPDPTNLYSEQTAGKLRPDLADIPLRVYVPNGLSNDVTVIDPATFEVIDTFRADVEPQHVVPGYDMQTLWVLNNQGYTLTPIDPRTGTAKAPIPVDDPYNLYFTPDGTYAVVVAEAFKRLDFRDPTTMEFKFSMEVPECDGINHMDYAVDGSFAIATCEFAGKVVKLDLQNRRVLGYLELGTADESMPQDVRVSPDGSTFYVADMRADGMHVVDGASFTRTGFVPTGVGCHGLYPSRDGTKLYVVNRGSNIIGGPPNGRGDIAVFDFASGEVVGRWALPGGGSPDMGNLTPDGNQLWLGGRYDDEVYVFDTNSGELLATIPVGKGPHGLTVWPQPGRYSLGHTGNMR